MKVLFLGLLYSNEIEQQLLEQSKNGLQGAANKFQWSIINGLEQYLEKPIDIFNCLPVGTFPKYNKKIVYKTYKWNHLKGALDKNIGFINIPLIKQKIREYRFRREVTEWINKNQNDEDLFIITYSLYLPYLKTLHNLSRENNKFKICLIVPDLPNEFGIPKYKKGLMRHIEFNRGKKQLKLSQTADSYILLTEAMKNPLDIKDKPYIVVEGISDSKEFIIESYKSNPKKNILYTGTLNREFGINNLIEAFTQINNEELELRICGSGDMEEEIRVKSEKYPNIKMYGYVSQEKIKELQSEATILINPRQNNNDFTKYSFPSKTMEYMMSGKPVICYKLDGIPDEYDNYLIYVEDNSVISLSNKIQEVFNYDEQMMREIGEKSKQFILLNKNSTIQGKKIIELLSSL